MVTTVKLQHRLCVRDLGLVAYDEAYRVQKQCVQDVLNHDRMSIVVCEHPSVLTLGRMTKAESLLCSEEKITARGVELRRIDRGGDVTLHAPGQLVCYPILNLKHFGKDLKWYLRALEDIIISVLKNTGVTGGRNPLNTGVWVGPRKIASIGIGVKKWASFHGLSININNDLQLYDMIKPCGLSVEMTSLARELVKPVAVRTVKNILIDTLAGHLELKKET